MASEIRQPRSDELAQARQIAEDSMAQVYRHLLGGVSLVAPEPEPWKNSWVALVDDVIVGVGMTRDDRVTDLWLLPQARGHRLGSQLLSLLEAEIKARDHCEARLRVVAENTRARAFYRARGWIEGDEFAQEQLGIPMLNMHKPLLRTSD